MVKPKKPPPAAPRRPPPVAVPADQAARFVATGDVLSSSQTSTSTDARERLETLPGVQERPETPSPTQKRLVARQSGERARRTIYLTPSTDAALEARCRNEMREASGVVELALRQYLGL